jgi:hypothetical protein
MPVSGGFMSKSPVQLICSEFLEKVTSAVDEGSSMDVIFIDFAKAFDKVPKKRLLVKLKSTWSGGKRAKVDKKLAHGQKTEWC